MRCGAGLATGEFLSQLRLNGRGERQQVEQPDPFPRIVVNGEGVLAGSIHIAHLLVGVDEKNWSGHCVQQLIC